MKRYVELPENVIIDTSKYHIKKERRTNGIITCGRYKFRAFDIVNQDDSIVNMVKVDDLILLKDAHCIVTYILMDEHNNPHPLDKSGVLKKKTLYRNKFSIMRKCNGVYRLIFNDTEEYINE